MSREGSDAEAGDDLKPLPRSAVEGEGGQAPPQPPQPPSGGKEDEHSVRVAAKRMSFRQSKKQRRQVRES